MAGTIVADTLSDGAGNTTAMDNAIYGSAKAWASYNSVTQTIRGSTYNVSSVTYNGTGNVTFNFTNAFTDANYAAFCSASVYPSVADVSCEFSTVYSTTQCGVVIFNVAGTATTNSPIVNLVVHK